MQINQRIKNGDNQKNKDETITVIIPTLNESAFLPHLLDALNAQSRTPDEIIIADAGSTDDTVLIARSYGARIIKGGLPAAGRNAGAKVSKNDLLLFLDADVRPGTDFIAQSMEEFNQKEYDIATCFIDSLDDNPMDKIICSFTNRYIRAIHPISPHAFGFCIFCRRIKHAEMGGFDETLILSEDIDYARRSKAYGKFGFLKSTNIPVSMRRVRKEGLIRIGIKYAWCEFYALRGEPVRRIPFEYEFGAFKQTH